MAQKTKKISPLTLLLYLLSVGLLAWIVPLGLNYYSSMKMYKSEVANIKKISLQHNIKSDAQLFNLESFKKSLKAFSSDEKVVAKEEGEYAISLSINKDELQKFNDFIETLSLQYLVKIKNGINFKGEDNIINIKLTIVEL